MENGFMNEIHNSGIIDELSLLRLTTTSALGASYLAAEKINCPFVKPYDSNVEVFFHYKRDHYPNMQKMKHAEELQNMVLNKDSVQESENEIL